MIELRPKDHPPLSVADDATVGDALAALGAGSAFGAVVAGRLLDRQTPLVSGGEFRPIFEDDPEAIEIVRHSSAHVMAQAVRDLFPDALLAIGPVIEDGFYYDIDVDRPFQPDDLPRIEARMAEIIAADRPIVRKVLPRDEALRFFAEDRYKVELISDLPADVPLSIYTQETFTDLCRGPHVPSTGAIKVYKLLSIAGAYWRGDVRRPMLQRIYGTAWRTRDELKAYLARIEEAKRRDHRVLGRDLDLFSIVNEVGSGLVLWHPKGAAVRNVIETFWRAEHIKGGYELIHSPHVGRAGLWATSGHLDFYRENMFAPMDVEGEEYFVKPMNCPFHIHIYSAQTRSWRALPIRFAELGTVYRYEKSGVLHGLLRVRGFTQDDAHIYCRPEEVKEEIRRVLRFCLFMLKSFGFTEFESYIATRPDEKYVGDPEQWTLAEESLKEAAAAEGLSAGIDAGGGAFYGPKIDLKIKDALGRAWQCSTIQFDFNLPERFKMEYIGADGRPARPYMIHRALLGSIERFFGCLIEHYAGAFPVWLAPVQAAILSVTEKAEDYAAEVAEALRGAGFRIELDAGADKIGKKIRTAETRKTPYMLVVGERDRENRTVSVRKRKEGDKGAMSIEAFMAILREEDRPTS
jgi:threonyl-tRNA synthetase